MLVAPSGSVVGQSADKAPAAGTQVTASIGPTYFIQPLSAGFHLPAGQTFVYDADWRLWTAGNATIKLENTGSEYHVTASADSIGVVAMLYRVADRFGGGDQNAFVAVGEFKPRASASDEHVERRAKAAQPLQPNGAVRW